MRFAGIILLLIIGDRLRAQQLSVNVFDHNTKLPIAGATVQYKQGIIFTDLTGNFKLANALTGDTIRISHVGYRPYLLIIGVLPPVVIYLVPDHILLDQVNVRARSNYQQDSLRFRKEFAKTFGYKAPGIKDVFITRSPYASTGRANSTSELLSVNVLQLIGFLTKGNTQTTKLQKALLRDEEDSYMAHKLSKEKIVALTGLKGDSLENFMFKYRPEVSALKKMTDYDIIIYIKKSYQDFIKP